MAAKFGLRLRERQSQRFRAMAQAAPNLVRDTMRECADDAKDDLQEVVGWFSVPPTFEIIQVGDAWQIVTGDLIFIIYDKGSKPHGIDAKRGSVLRFPGVQRGGNSQDGYVYTQHVDHPGTKPHNVTEGVYQFWNGQLQTRMQAALNAGMSAVGL